MQGIMGGGGGDLMSRKMLAPFKYKYKYMLCELSDGVEHEDTQTKFPMYRNNVSTVKKGLASF